NLGVVIKELLVKKQVKNHRKCFYLCVTKVSQEEVDSEPTQTIDPHIQKKIYEKSLEQSDTEKAPTILVEQFHDLKNAFMIDAKQLLMKDGKFENGIQNIIECLKKYANRRPANANEPRPDQVSIDMTHGDENQNNVNDTDVSIGHRDPTDSEVHQLLLLLHLLFTKYKALPVNSNNQSSTSKSTGTNNEIELTGFWSRGQTREQTDGSKSALASKGNGDLMTDENLLLIKKMLLNDKNSKKDIINFLKGFTSQDNSVSPRNVALVYNSGLFHIVLEYALKHIVYSRIDEEVVDLLCCCFKLLRGIAASNKEIRNEMFLYFSNFLQFKQVTNDMICLINEIFYGNTYVCNKLTKYDLGKVLYAAIIGPFDHYQWTIVLQTIIENSDQVEAQEHIAQLISKHSNDYLQHVLCPREQSKATYWLKILQCDKTDRQKNECHLLLNITDLLASCASGECQYARLVAMKLFTFNELIKILSNPSILSHRKIPYLCILTWTYLNKKIFTSSSAQYKSLWSHIVSTIKNFDKGREVTSQDADRSNCIMYLQNINKRMTKVMGLFYITYGVIPFLSQFVLSEHFEVELYGIKNTLLKFRDKWKCVSKQLSKFKCIEKIDLLLKKRNPNLMINPPCPSPADEAQNGEPLQLIEPNYEELMKHSIFTLHNIVSLLKSLINQQKIDPLPCLKRLDLEQTILRTLKTLIEQMKQSTKEKQHFDTSQTKIILFFGTDDVTTSTGNYKANLFDLLAEDQNIEIVIAVMKVLQCLNSDQNSVIKDEKEAKNIQTKIVDC
uniref:Uncharacterized protein n=1 Tax=Amphimedon queenslandica TaxID=400682 RepID=A0A1X7UYU1_AMPQE